MWQLPPKPCRGKRFCNVSQRSALLPPSRPWALPATPAPKAEKRVRVAVLGCGIISNMYLPHLSKSPFVELVSTCDIISERAVQAVAKYSIPNHYPHINQLLAGTPFEMLMNLTNMQEHGRLNK